MIVLLSAGRLLALAGYTFGSRPHFYFKINGRNTAAAIPAKKRITSTRLVWRRTDITLWVIDSAVSTRIKFFVASSFLVQGKGAGNSPGSQPLVITTSRKPHPHPER